MHEATLRADVDPDSLSFLHAVRVVRRHLPWLAAFSLPQDVAAIHDEVLMELADPQDRVVSSRRRRTPRRVKRKMTKYHLRPGGHRSGCGPVVALRVKAQ